MNIIEGKLIAEGQKIAIVAGRFNEIITNKLLGGAIDAFKRHGGDENNIDVAWVPGSFEIPLVAKKMAETKKYDAVIIGAGPMGIFTAYELMLKAPEMKVLLIDKGNDIYHRNCPILAKKIKHPSQALRRV